MCALDERPYGSCASFRYVFRTYVLKLMLLYVRMCLGVLVCVCRFLSSSIYLHMCTVTNEMAMKTITLAVYCTHDDEPLEHTFIYPPDHPSIPVYSIRYTIPLHVGTSLHNTRYINDSAHTPRMHTNINHAQRAVSTIACRIETMCVHGKWHKSFYVLSRVCVERV